METPNTLAVVPAPEPAVLESAIPAPPVAPPARPSAAARAADRLARLQEQLKAAKQQERAALDRQAAIVGHALIAAMRADARVRGVVVDVLRRTVTRPADRAEIAPLLIEAVP